VKQFYPIVALLVMLAGAWFFFTNWQVDLANNPQLVPRAPGASGLPSLTDLFPTQPPPAPGGPAGTMPNQPSSLAVPQLGTLPASPAPSTGNLSGSAPPSQGWNLAQVAGRLLSGAAPPAAVPQRPTIRIASFNIEVFGEAKMSQPDVVNVLANVAHQFDVVAIQEIRAQSQDILPRFVQAINSTGRRYDYVIGPRLGRSSSKEQYAYVFDTETLEVDRRALYTVSDPDDLMHREPLVAWFRSRATDPRGAFTFSLVNVHLDPDEAAAEVDVLDDVFLAVRDDGRREDDVIILGDLNVDDRHLGHLARLANVAWVITNTATNTRGNAQYDNLLFDQAATTEFTGRGGVFDFMREYNLSLEQALRVSDHLVVWAEFHVQEGGVPGQVASQPGWNQQSRSSWPASPQAGNSGAYRAGYPQSSPQAGYYAPAPGATAPYAQPGYQSPAASQAQRPYYGTPQQPYSAPAWR
jgi:endonuclease/exonuclease/phosphatase family metal-dependent hydrolase